MSVQREAELEHAVRQFVRAGVCETIGEHFTCGEAEALAQILVLGGEAEWAETLMYGHILSDDEGDDHFTSNPEDEAKEIITACKQLAAM